ncbi:hypothetical protein SEVIR_2G177066v4 [Setaria viridis]
MEPEIHPSGDVGPLLPGTGSHLRGEEGAVLGASESPAGWEGRRAPPRVTASDVTLAGSVRLQDVMCTPAELELSVRCMCMHRLLDDDANAASPSAKLRVRARS